MNRAFLIKFRIIHNRYHFETFSPNYFDRILCLRSFSFKTFRVGADALPGSGQIIKEVRIPFLASECLI